MDRPEVIGSLDETQRRLLRLGVIIGGGSLAIASALAVDGWLSKQYWTPTENQFTGIDSSAQEVSVSFGGLGVTCSEALAEDARKFLPGIAGHVTYSSKGFSMNHLAEQFCQKAAGTKLLHLYGHSMGGAVGLETPRIANITDMKLGQVVLNCSPFDNNDVHLGRYTKLLEMVRWPVGPGGKLLFSFGRSTLEGKPFQEAWQQAKYDALNGCSPSLFLSQISTLRSINLTAQQEAYKSLIGPETKVLYCRPESPLEDIVVNTPQASERFADFFYNLGVPYEDVLIPNIGHAQSGPTSDFLANRAA